MAGIGSEGAQGVLLEEFVQAHFEGSAEFAQVRRVARALHNHLNTPEALRAIAHANQPGVSSAIVQNTFLAHARQLGFTDESKGLFAHYATSGLRPDYYLAVDGTGILLEVERGKTTTNNMDFLDFWKCHLCEHANYLFLMVPRELRHNSTMAPKKEFNAVVKRLSSFFVPRNYTNVRGLFVFGY